MCDDDQGSNRERLSNGARVTSSIALNTHLALCQYVIINKNSVRLKFYTNNDSFIMPL